VNFVAKKVRNVGRAGAEGDGKRGGQEPCQL
jgi:hypothetical protein